MVFLRFLTPVTFETSGGNNRMFPYVEHTQGSGGQAGPWSRERVGRGSRRRQWGGTAGGGGVERGSLRDQEELLFVAGKGGARRTLTPPPAL